MVPFGTSTLDGRREEEKSGVPRGTYSEAGGTAQECGCPGNQGRETQ